MEYLDTREILGRLSAMADQAVTADNFNASGWGATPTISAVFVMDLMDENYRAKVAAPLSLPGEEWIWVTREQLEASYPLPAAFRQWSLDF